MTRSLVGHVTLAAGSSDMETPGDMAPPIPPSPSPQYSPSISHDDEIEGEGLGASGTSMESKVVQRQESSEVEEIHGCGLGGA